MGSWQEERERARRGAAMERARRAAMPRAKLIFPDGRWLWVRASSHFDARCEAEKGGLAVLRQTRFCAADWPTEDEKELKGWVQI